jgi:hypothetical protein
MALLSQGQDPEMDLAKYFQEVRNGGSPTLPVDLSQSRSENEALDLLEHFASDSLQIVERKALELIGMLAGASEDSAVRRRGVNMVLTRASRQVGMSLSLLKGFQKMDFSDSAKNIVRQLVRMEGPSLTEWIRMAGFLELKDLVSNIRQLSQPGNSQGLRWAAIISLARMGDASAISDMMRRIRRLPVNDDMVYRVFPDLIFTRQREAISFIVEAMQDRAKNCQSADAEIPQAIPCGYRIMEQLAPVIVDFPFSVDSSGDLQTNDYPEALEVVRKWFQTNTNYQIAINTY